jgi:peroxiredoxin
MLTKRYPVFLFLLMMICGHSLWAAQSMTELKEKELAPRLSLKDMEGVTHRLEDFRGKTVIINFWATWCPPCRAELPSMNRAWEKVKGDNVEMLAINVGEDDDTIFEFLGDYPIDFKVLLDQSGKIIQTWPVRGLPTTFVIDPKGRLVYRAIGGREWDSDSLLQKIRMLNAEKKSAH